MLFGQKLVLLLGLNGFMGNSAELFVGDKPITFDEFKATKTIHNYYEFEIQNNLKPLGTTTLCLWP